MYNKDYIHICIVFIIYIYFKTLSRSYYSQLYVHFGYISLTIDLTEKCWKL